MNDTDISILKLSEAGRAALDQLAAEKARADDLSRMVAAMGHEIDVRRDVMADVDGNPREAMIAAATALNEIDKILSRPDVAAERGRWVPLPSSPWLAGIYSCPSCSVIWTAWGPTTVQPRGSMSCHGEPCSICEPLDVVPMERIEVADFINERDAAIARAEKAEAGRDAEAAWRLRVCKALTQAESATLAAERSSDELGLQLAAQSERLRLAMACVEAGNKVRDALVDVSEEAHHVYLSAYDDALAALDAVPGDALAKVGTMNGVPVHVDPNLPEHMPAVGFTDARWVGPDGEPER